MHGAVRGGARTSSARTCFSSLSVLPDSKLSCGGDPRRHPCTFDLAPPSPVESDSSWRLLGDCVRLAFGTWADSLPAPVGCDAQLWVWRHDTGQFNEAPPSSACTASSPNGCTAELSSTESAIAETSCPYSRSSPLSIPISSSSAFSRVERATVALTTVWDANIFGISC